MSRALDLTLEPLANARDGLRINSYTYAYCEEVRHAGMREQVYFDLSAGVVQAMAQMTPDEARVLANQLLQVADTCDEHRARRESLEEIEEQLLDPDFDTRLVHYHHPDVVYAEPDRMSEVAAANPGKIVIGIADGESYGGGCALAATDQATQVQA